MTRMELDQNRMLESLRDEMTEKICANDLSAETVDNYVNNVDENEFLQYALNETIHNFSQAACYAFIDATEKSDDEIRQFYKFDVDYTRALHAACDKFLGTTFF
jgi:hypothetical protein